MGIRRLRRTGLGARVETRDAGRRDCWRQHGKGLMIRVRVRSNESVQQLIKRFNKLCEKEGLTRDIKRSAYYEKPSERRRRKERKSRKRALAATRL